MLDAGVAQGAGERLAFVVQDVALRSDHQGRAAGWQVVGKQRRQVRMLQRHRLAARRQPLAARTAARTRPSAPRSGGTLREAGVGAVQHAGVGDRVDQHQRRRPGTMRSRTGRRREPARRRRSPGGRRRCRRPGPGAPGRCRSGRHAPRCTRKRRCSRRAARDKAPPAPAGSRRRTPGCRLPPPAPAPPHRSRRACRSPSRRRAARRWRGCSLRAAGSGAPPAAASPAARWDPR